MGTPRLLDLIMGFMSARNVKSKIVRESALSLLLIDLGIKCSTGPAVCDLCKDNWFLVETPGGS